MVFGVDVHIVEAGRVEEPLEMGVTIFKNTP
jgi:hypothetical protein